MIFDMLVYAYNNESLGDVADIFKKILMLSETGLIRFADYILNDDSNEFIRILLKCSDTTVRDAVVNILITGINRMFDKIDLIEKAEKFMTKIINSILTDCASNWTKFDHFFKLIKQVTIAGEAQTDFMKKNELATTLADFFLAEKSPIKPFEEKRMCMGNNYSKPTFDSLISTI
jgi:hypothetical protein